MEWLSNLLRIFVILFVLIFVIVALYSLRHIITDVVTNIGGIEEELRTWISQAENRANLLQSLTGNQYTFFTRSGTGTSGTSGTGTRGTSTSGTSGTSGTSTRGTSISTSGTSGTSGSGSGSRNEGFQNATENTTLDQSLLLDIQPLSIKDTGFLGPYPKGRYKEDTATANAIKAGCRFLTLQIDYTDSKMDLSIFEAPGIPSLLVRGPDSVLLSKNSGDIKDVINTIANIGFNPIAPNSRLPIIIYLHIVRAPSVVNTPDVYLDFLSSIADSLNAMAPFHLGLTSIGNFTRQKMSEELLTTPLNQLEGKVIIMSNADTSLFRRTSINKNKYPPSKDLDFWVNMRVYLDTPDDSNGITQLADTTFTPSAVLVDLKRVLGLSTVNKEAFAMKGKRRFVIAMGERTTNPSPEQLAIALNRLGVNVIPIDIFTGDDRDVLLLTNEYTNKTFQQKPANLQYIS